jgi:hypothetical protein
MLALFRLLFVPVFVGALAVSVLAQATLTGSVLPPAESEDDASRALYHRFIGAYKTDQSAAYRLAKEYLQKYPQDTEPAIYLKRWVDAYQQARKAQFHKLSEEKRSDEAFALGKEILDDDPNDIKTLYTLTLECLVALDNGNKAFVQDAVGYARKAIELIESGRFRTVVNTKDEDLSILNSALGFLFLKSNPSQAVKYLYKADALKKDAQVYGYLATAIYDAECAPLLEALNSSTTPQQKALPEAKAVKAKFDAGIDRVVDALARAVAMANTEPKLAAKREFWMKDLTKLYKYRNGGPVTGLDDYIEKVLTTPLLK